MELWKDILIGKNEWIAPLIDASLTIDSAGFYKDYELGIVKMMFKIGIAAFDTPFVYWARSWKVAGTER